MSLIPHILTSANVTVYIDGEPVVVANGTAQYDLVLKAITLGDLQAVKDAINVRQSVVNLSQGKIELDGKILKYDGRPLHGALTDRILSVVKEAGNAAPLLLFLENLMQNPSKRAVDELYGFLEVCDLPITVDGYFLAYKRVNADYTSIHDSKTDNSIGSTPALPRNAVDEDKDRTCSSGLHFCSKSYLPHFGAYGNGNRTVVVKINPRDVVAIPSDYNNAKGRASTYEIVGEVTSDSDGGFDELAVNYDTKFVKAPAPAPLAAASAPVAKTAGSAPKPVAAPSPVGQTSLTDQQVRNIRQYLKENWPLATIAKVENTSARTVARIRDGETYTHVK